MKRVFEYLKVKWGINTVWDFIAINFVFALAGMFIVFERKPIFHLFGIEKETAFWIKACVYVPVVFPLYQLNLLIFGFLFGKFPFFWEKEKQIARFFKKKVLRLGT